MKVNFLFIAFIVCRELSLYWLLSGVRDGLDRCVAWPQSIENGTAHTDPIFSIVKNQVNVSHGENFLSQKSDLGQTTLSRDTFWPNLKADKIFSSDIGGEAQSRENRERFVMCHQPKLFGQTESSLLDGCAEQRTMADIQGWGLPVAYLTNPRYHPTLQEQIPHASQMQRRTRRRRRSTLNVDQR